MKIAGDWMARAETRAVCAMLTDSGHQALFVGGCVRNALIGMAVADVDIATDAQPETVTRLAASAGLRAVPTGFEHGTVTVVSGGIPHEVTTFRRDVETDGRHATVSFTSDVAEDAARRDFTMNALYATPQGEVIDPLAGLPDLLERRVRFVGDPAARIAEDHLRILRFFRFHAWYGDPGAGIDAEGLAACADAADGLDSLSRERVGAEMRKLLSADDPAPAVAAMAQAGLLARVLPGASADRLAVLSSMDRDAGPNWLGRLALIGGEAEGLRLSRTESRDLEALRNAIASTWSPAVIGWRLGLQLGWYAVAIRSILTGAPLPAQFTLELARGAGAQLPVRAQDLMPDLRNAALGERLKAIEAEWLASDLRKTRAELLR